MKRWGILWAAVTLTAAGGLSACSSGSASSDSAADGASPGGAQPVSESQGTNTPASSPSAGPTDRDWTGNNQPVTMAFAGDVHFQPPIRQQLLADPDTLFSDIAPVLSNADITVANLETALTDRGSPAGKAYTFRDPPQGLTALKAAGVDVVSGANNHGMDYGLDGLSDTLVAENDTGMPIIGIGNDDTEAYAPYLTEVRGQRVGIIAASHVIDDHLVEAWTAGPGKPGMANAMISRMDQAVADLRPQVDTLVVFPHWGIEDQNCPSDFQRKFVDRMYAAGADIVVGAHTHRLMGAGFHNEMFVGYGLGNFAFYIDYGPSADSGVMEVTATGREINGYQWIPARISNGLPRPLTGQAAATAKAQWEQLRDCTGLTPGAQPQGPAYPGTDTQVPAAP